MDTPEERLARALDAVMTAQREVLRARQEAERAVEARSAALRAAREAGATWSAMGEALGVTGARVIAMARPAAERSDARRKD